MVEAFIPGPPVSGIHLGPLAIHAYGLMYVTGIAMAVHITARRWGGALEALPALRPAAEPGPPLPARDISIS